ncbi:MAG: ATP-grasp domain-containing protein [Patescibacteria group bacterium]|nr:ATP-grasp domain-containing protein [Patescibacteria group bacterium]
MYTVAIVTSDDKINDPSIRILTEKSEKFNFKVKVIANTSDITSDLKPSIIYPRINPGYDKKEFDRLVGLFELLIKKYKAPYINSPHLLKTEYDKFLMAEEAEKCGVRTPRTYKPEDYNKLGFPMVVKEIYGYGGKGVFLVNDKNELKDIITNDRSYLIQEFIKLEHANDYRVYVVGGKAVGGLFRENKDETEFRSNTALGGKAKFIYPSRTLRSLAEEFAKKISGDIICADFIKKGRSYYFIEFNHAFSLNLKKDRIVNKVFKYFLSRINNNRSN